MSFRKSHIAILLLVFCVLIAWKHSPAQDRKTELEQSKQQIEQEIAYTTRLLEETRKSKQVSINELSLLQTQIRTRENLVATLQKQLILLETRISRTKRELQQVEAELQSLKKEYSRMISFAYKNRSGLNTLMFLFSSENFNQAYRRLKHLQQYAALRKEQIQKIQLAQQKLEATQKSLEAEQAEKNSLLEAEKRQQIALNNERMNLDLSLRKIGQQEKQLNQTISRKEQEARKLQREIEAIIAEEIRKASRLKEAEALPDRLMHLTPEEKLLSDSFSKNRTKLPWPVERGVIAANFGKQAHPVLKKVTINNRGIDIATTKGSEARAVFDGIVVSVNLITATNNAVIIRHGDFFTVYSNLERVYVKRGDKVKTKEVIGLIHTDKIEGKTELHFELWQDRNLINPAQWLAK
ncbi:MAG: peptidoglycan DD-metalloendopeptidase family protein [Bacteroidales bacterium]|jgi:septal ring factor EnvC (AmiA/AmiB activator)|nr:peptidoglycan DD-metalloendopeptidase family protein [Bacteroidales bacterium]MDD3701998.1 peptidoglycan DD-metalloendopeptidase family protein [Bacteroidales bacterium]MDY0368988.1 peptidoglycan DD-metalloendopeptidase family protein [Bacteroidales bacterium]